MIRVSWAGLSGGKLKGAGLPPISLFSVQVNRLITLCLSAGEGSEWKQRDNVIRKTLPNGREAVRFVPVLADETSAAIEELCWLFQTTWVGDKVDRLLLIDAFILDFLCIHSFSYGNGRAARLLNLLLLYAAGYEVGRYVSLERIIESTKETYYEALRLSGLQWETGQHDLTPWHQYSLGVIVYAYREFEQRVDEVTMVAGGKSQSVKNAISAFKPGETFTIGDLERICPAVSRATIRRVLEALRKEGQVICLGTGRNAQWRRTETRS